MKHPCWWKLMVIRKSLYNNLKRYDYQMIIEWQQRLLPSIFMVLASKHKQPTAKTVGWFYCFCSRAIKADEVLYTGRGKKSFWERYMNTEPAASDNMSRMRLVLNYELVLLLCGLRNMKRKSVFARQVYMNFVRCWCDSQVLQGGIIKVFAKVWEHGADEIDA